MILVTGATGKVGSEAVRLLRRRELPVRALVREASNEVFVSVAALLEIAVKVGAEKLVLDVREVAEHLIAQRYRLLGVTVEHAVVLARLPRHHRDPFDRLIAAQALEDGLTVVTRDPAFAAFGCKVLW